VPSTNDYKNDKLKKTGYNRLLLLQGAKANKVAVVVTGTFAMTLT